eukprot:7886961-Pyramimonas_sp.AAC.1
MPARCSGHNSLGVNHLLARASARPHSSMSVLGQWHVASVAVSIAALVLVGLEPPPPRDKFCL